MESLHLIRLAKEARTALEAQLSEQQSSKCFVSDPSKYLTLDELDIDQIIPTRESAKGDPTNFTLRSGLNIADMIKA